MTGRLTLDECKHVPQKSAHPGHVPDDPRTLLIEEIAMIMCPLCSDGQLRWQDRHDESFCHADDTHDEAVDCEATFMLQAARDADVPIYTGAELEFDQL